MTDAREPDAVRELARRLHAVSKFLREEADRLAAIAPEKLTPFMVLAEMRAAAGMAAAHRDYALGRALELEERA